MAVDLDEMMSTQIPLEAFRNGEGAELAYAFWVLELLLPEWVPSIVLAHLGRKSDTEAMISVAGLVQPNRADDGRQIEQAFADICGRSMSPIEATNMLQANWAKRFLSASSQEEQIGLLQEADRLHDITLDAGSSLFGDCTYFASMIGYDIEIGSPHHDTLNNAVAMVRDWQKHHEGGGGK